MICKMITRIYNGINCRQLNRKYMTTLTPPLFIEVPVASHESERSCICVLGVSVLPLSAIV